MATVAKTAEWDARDAAAMRAVLDAQRASFNRRTAGDGRHPSRPG